MPLQTGIFSGLLADERARIAAEQRSSLENPQTPLSMPAEWLLDIFNGGRTDSGIRVSQLTAFQVTTFLSCVDLISGSIASLPRHVYERSFLPKTKRAVHRIAYEHDYHDLVHIAPNDEMSSFTLFKAMAAHFLAWGNSYVELQRDGGNKVLAMWPRNPDKTKPKRLAQSVRLGPVAWRPFPVNIPAGTMVYVTTDGIDDQDTSENDASASRSERIIPADDMVHIPGLALDGRMGQSVVYLARNALGLALAAEKFGSKYFANYAQPGGMLEAPLGLRKDQRDEARKSWMEAQGGENAHRTAVLPAGFKWTATSSKPEEAQTIETRKFVRNEICSVLHVPPHMVGDVDKGRANTEQLAQEFLSYTLAPWLTAIKQEFKRKMFPDRGIGRTPKNTFYVDFDLWKMLRPDSASREKYYMTGRSIAGICSNDFREYEGLNPIDEDWAEDFWMPINMTLVDTPIDPTQGAQSDDDSKGDKTKGQGDEKNSKRYVALYSRMFRDAFGRILARDKADLKDFTRSFGPVLWSLADCFAQEKRGAHGRETDLFIAEYLGAMQKRRAAWSDTDEAAGAELLRAVKAVRIAVYRDVATQLALAEEEATQLALKEEEDPQA